MEEQIDIKDLLNYSAIFGLGLVAFSVGTELLGLDDNVVVSILQLVVIVLGVFFVVRYIRDHLLEGYISYSKLIRLSVMVSFLGGVILGFYTYIYLIYIQPDTIDQLFDVAYSQLQEQGKSEEEIASEMTMYEEVYTPSTLAITNVFMVIFTGFLSSLLFGLLLKNDPELPIENENASNE